MQEEKRKAGRPKTSTKTYISGYVECEVKAIAVRIAKESKQPLSKVIENAIKMYVS